MRTLVRTVALAVVIALVAAACGGSDDQAAPEPTPTPEASVAPTATTAPTAAPTPTAGPTPPPVPGSLPPVAVPILDGDDELVGFDPDVRTGTLDNGLTYYIRRNTAPGTRAELRLAIDAGSALEDDDQAGVAHFLEHMLFNGTERYPANELVAVLEAFGSEFGPDVNAYTSIDETVYELSVPTDDRALFVEAFDVLAEWASKATIDPDEVVAERGVVLEEWRLRDQGLGGRIGDLYSELLTPGTPYQDRLPIGNSDAISATTADVVQRFYDDWYRPDLMAVVAVGDFVVDDVEALIRERFADLTGPDDPRPVPAIELPDADEFAYARLADPEMPSAFIEVFYEGQAETITTLGDYRRAVAYSLAADILGNRFDDDVSRGDVPYLSASPGAVGLARDLDAPSFSISGPPEVLEESLGLVLTELERIRRDGIEVAEFDRAIAAHRSIIEQRHAGRETTQDFEYASEYVDHFLGDVASISWDDFLATESRLLDEMTPDYVVAAFLDRLGGRAPQVVVVGPEDEADLLPTETDVQALIDRIAGSDVEPRIDESRDIDALMVAPDPAPVVETFFDDQLGTKVLRFENGVIVALKPTTIAENLFSIGGVNPGGTSVLDERDLAAAFIATDVVSSSGVGDLDQVELDRLLADRVAFASVTLDVTSERIDAGGGSEDTELVLQLVHQYLTAPRAQPSALTTAVTELEPFAADPGALPFLASSVALLDARYGEDPRYRLLPEPDALAAITAGDVERVYESLVGDASGSVFAIVGDFDPAEMEDLAARYLGTLPADGRPDDFVDHQPPPPDGIVAREVAVGRDPQAEVTILVTAELETDLITEIELAVLENVLSTRLRDRLREALGATYSPIVAVGSTETPDALVETFIQISGDPDRVEEIAAEAEAVLADLRTGGLTETALATGREQVRRDFELVSNLFWIEQMLFAETHPDVTMLTVPQRVDTAARVSLADANGLLAQVLPADQYILVTMVPED